MLLLSHDKQKATTSGSKEAEIDKMRYKLPQNSKEILEEVLVGYQTGRFEDIKQKIPEEFFEGSAYGVFAEIKRAGAIFAPNAKLAESDYLKAKQEEKLEQVENKEDLFNRLFRAEKSLLDGDYFFVEHSLSATRLCQGPRFSEVPNYLRDLLEEEEISFPGAAMYQIRKPIGDIPFRDSEDIEKEYANPEVYKKHLELHRDCLNAIHDYLMDNLQNWENEGSDTPSKKSGDK